MKKFEEEIWFEKCFFFCVLEARKDETRSDERERNPGELTSFFNYFQICLYLSGF